MVVVDGETADLPACFDWVSLPVSADGTNAILLLKCGNEPFGSRSHALGFVEQFFVVSATLKGISICPSTLTWLAIGCSPATRFSAEVELLNGFDQIAHLAEFFRNNDFNFRMCCKVFSPLLVSPFTRPAIDTIPAIVGVVLVEARDWFLLITIRTSLGFHVGTPFKIPTYYTSV